MIIKRDIFAFKLFIKLYAKDLLISIDKYQNSKIYII